MKLLIAIPSKGRADSIFKRTMRWVARTGFDVRVFVEPQDMEAYRAAVDDGNYQEYLDVRYDQLIDIGKNDGGLAYVKGFIKRYAEENGYSLVFKMDDDVLRFTQRGKNLPDEAMVLQFAGMVAKCRKTFNEYPDVAAIGFPYRNELYEPKEWTHINARLQTCYLIRTEYLNDGFNTLEDFAQYIAIRKANKVTLRYGLLGIDVADVGKTGGGLQMFDREVQLQEELPKLREMYPALEFKPVKGKAWSLEPVMAGEFFDRRKL